MPLILRSRDCEPYRLKEFDVSSSIIFCPLPNIFEDRFLPPIAGEINDTSKDTVLVFLNIPRLFSALQGAFGWGDLQGEMARTVDPLLDELREELAELSRLEPLL